MVTKYSISLNVFAALLLFLICTQVSLSQVQGIDGTWYSGEKALTVEINDGGWRFSVTNEAGKKSTGKAFNESVIYLPSENISGQIEYDATIIEWSDGTFWAREPFTGDTPAGVAEE